MAGDGRWEELDRVALDDDFVRGATIHELDHRARRRLARKQRRRSRLRVRARVRRPQGSTLALVAVVGTLLGLLGAGAVGVGPAAWMAGSLGIGEDAEAVFAGTEKTTSTIAEVTTTTDHGLEGGAYRKGDCIIWNEKVRIDSDVPVRTVRCSEPHLFEATGNFDLPGAMNYPDDATWDVISTERCEPLTAKHLGAPLVSTGRFYTSMIRPFEDGWRAGDRTVHCGIFARTAVWDGSLVPDADRFATIIGAVKGQSQEVVPPVSTCYGPAADGGGMDTVPCAGPHELEVSGHVGLEGRFDHVPTDDELDRRIAGDCRGVTARYLGRPLRRDESVSWMPISEEEWSAGWRTLPCSVGRTKGGDWAPVTGSLATR